MNLSKRLTMNLSMLSHCCSLADVGCDHAYSCIYAIQNHICDYCYACDIRKGPLSIARNNILNNGLSHKIKTVLCDGLELISPGDVDAILVSGMGGMTICNILNEGKEVVLGASQLVLQPQSDISKVRHLVHELGFVIDNEKMCMDEGKYYTCIHCVKGVVIPYEEEFMYEYGKILLDDNDKLLHEYINGKKDKLLKIKNQCVSYGSGNNIDMLDIELEMLTKALDYMKR
ncbi:MAG: class I SAM-dependent methyltransferase [Clostridiales bacterium]|nr:class I SAM-dependent methyltransferase [Clostridiales bacterium]